MTIADHRLVEVFEEWVDGGRIVGHQGAESFCLNAGRGLSQIWWGGGRSADQSCLWAWIHSLNGTPTL
jgi:hypothetical protein